MKLKMSYATDVDIPVGYEALYTLVNGQYVFTGIDGIKSQEDIDRLQTSLNKERLAHKETKTTLSKFASLGDVDEISDELGNYEALEALANGKGNQDVEKLVAIQTRQLQSQLDKVASENQILKQEKEQFIVREKTAKISAALRKAAVNAKVIESAVDDVIALNAANFDFAEDGSLIRSNEEDPNFGMKVDDWFTEQKTAKPYLWAPSQGGGATGNAGAKNVANPWKSDNFSLAKQAEIFKADPNLAKRLAKQAGIDLDEFA